MQVDSSPMLKMVQTFNPTKEYPSRLGKKWSEDEEVELINELSENRDIEQIALNHERTVGGIKCRIRDIVYKMYENGSSLEEIKSTMKLEDTEILDMIQYKEEKEQKKKSKIKKLEKTLTDTEQELLEKKAEHLNTMKEISEIKKEIRMMNENIVKIYQLLQKFDVEVV